MREVRLRQHICCRARPACSKYGPANRTTAISRVGERTLGTDIFGTNRCITDDPGEIPAFLLRLWHLSAGAAFVGAAFVMLSLLRRLPLLDRQRPKPRGLPCCDDAAEAPGVSPPELSVRLVPALPEIRKRKEDRLKCLAERMPRCNFKNSWQLADTLSG